MPYFSGCRKTLFMPTICMRWFLVLAMLIASAVGQVVTPVEVKNSDARALQERYLPQLKAVGSGVSALTFPYHFYLTRALDVEERKQVPFQQASIQFDKFQDNSVVQITGNYYASYSDDLMNKGRRARQTFTDVMLPILRVAVPQFTSDIPFQSYALEISHHVRGKLLGVLTENTENFVMVLPREAAGRLVAAKTPGEQQAALLDGRAFVNGEPMTIWMSDDLQTSTEESPAARGKEVAAPAMGRRFPQWRKNKPALPLQAHLSIPKDVQLNNINALPESFSQNNPISDNSPQTLQRLKFVYKDSISRMKLGLASQAHFVDYAPPSFIPFRQGVYLQIPVATNLQGAGVSSQYRLAALAFDQHIAHLIRPAMAYFVEQMDFDGIDFSTTVHTSDGEGVESVEFIVPALMLRRYEQYDCTGQQLINSSVVLANGERISLDLQSAEAQATH